MTKHFSLTIAAEKALEDVDKRQRSRFVSDAIIAHAKKKDIFSNYNTSKKNTTQVKNQAIDKVVIESLPSESSNKSNQENNQIQFDEDF